MITDSGVCCAFNLESDLKESSYSHLVEEMQVKELAESVFGTILCLSNLVEF